VFIVPCGAWWIIGLGLVAAILGCLRGLLRSRGASTRKFALGVVSGFTRLTGLGVPHARLFHRQQLRLAAWGDVLDCVVVSAERLALIRQCAECGQVRLPADSTRWEA
jgi:hypothetical protein